MAKVYVNRAWMTTATTGTGTVTLGTAQANCFTFAEAGVANGDTASYVILDGGDVEIGTGTYTSAGTLFSRDTVTISRIAGTAGTTKLTLSGAATIFLTEDANDARANDGSGPPYKQPATSWLGNSVNTTTLITTAGVANRMEIGPWVSPFDVTIDQVGLLCSTAVAAALGKVVIYASDTNGRPSTLLLESGTLDFSTIGFKSIAASLSMTKGTLYWVGVRYSSTATVNAHQPYCSPVIGYLATPTTAANKMLRRTLTFATGATTPWGYLVSEEVAANVPAVFMRVLS